MPRLLPLRIALLAAIAIAQEPYVGTDDAGNLLYSTPTAPFHVCTAALFFYLGGPSLANLEAQAEGPFPLSL